jgi:hypothetical protein
LPLNHNSYDELNAMACTNIWGEKITIPALKLNTLLPKNTKYKQLECTITDFHL